MKRLGLFFAILAAGLLLGMSSLWAASSVNIGVSAEVPDGSPEISVTILKFTDGDPDNNPWTNSEEVTSMNFGTLKHTFKDGSEAGLWFSDVGFCVVIYAQPYGQPYEIKSTCTGLVFGSNALPAGSFGLVPAYSENDKWTWGPKPEDSQKQGPMPDGAELGTPGPAIATDKLIYSSESGTATARIIQAYYSIPPKKKDGSDPYNGFEPIPLSQPPGIYTGTVTITISTK
ncbi:MAG: hypothetical protein B6D55_04530 [Candidatus Omnitrophica bacterium 4484_70.2]|nr:MAG: hypothetical protein B6D55_04530 [Candidatus Omnitrophica bacterium 4484_70.2]